MEARSAGWTDQTRQPPPSSSIAVCLMPLWAKAVSMVLRAFFLKRAAKTSVSFGTEK